VDPFVRVYPDLIEPFLCASIIDKFEADTRKVPGRVEGYGRSAAKECVDLVIHELPDWEYLCRALELPVATSLRRYRAEVPNFDETQRGALRETGFQVQRYLPNGQDGFAWHSDVASRPSSERVLGMIAYLNDVAEGGETEFRSQQLSIKPKRGTIAWFPPTFPYVHRGATPISGPKYIVTCFVIYPK
jgi:hypothetical protein